MQNIKKCNATIFAGVTANVFAVIMLSVLTIMSSLLLTLFTPTITLADNTASQNNNFANPNWQSMNQYDFWNWQHNWAYHAPQYKFETTFSHDQWGRPTTSNIAPQHTQNIRRDRHSAVLPPVHGSQTGFFSGEFATGQLNPLAPMNNNNPNASRVATIEEPIFALLSGEAGVNVRADGTHSSGFLTSTNTMQSGHQGVAAVHTPISQAISNQTGLGIGQLSTTRSTAIQAGNQTNRVTNVTPFGYGTIGRITIPTLNNRTASIRSGVALSTLNNYVGHFSYTSQWDGNISLASHNRGQGSFFADIWTLQYGDIIIYETTMGVRVYEVVSIVQISENDLSNLDHSHENILNLITCVFNQPALRWSIRAREVV